MQIFAGVAPACGRGGDLKTDLNPYNFSSAFICLILVNPRSISFIKHDIIFVRLLS